MMVMVIGLHRSSARPCDFEPGTVKMCSSWPIVCLQGTTNAWEEGLVQSGMAGIGLAKLEQHLTLFPTSKPDVHHD